MSAEAVGTVVAAVGAGLAAGAKDSAAALVKEAYGLLRRLIVARLRKGNEPLEESDAGSLVDGSAKQSDAAERLRQQLFEVGVDDPTIEAAERLLELVAEHAAKYKVDASHAKNVNVGDHNTFHITIQ